MEHSTDKKVLFFCFFYCFVVFVVLYCFVVFVVLFVVLAIRVIDAQQRFLGFEPLRKGGQPRAKGRRNICWTNGLAADFR